MLVCLSRQGAGRGDWPLSPREPAAIRAALIEVGRRLHEQGLITAMEGNLSVRDGDAIYMTAAGVNKGTLLPEQVLRADLHGTLDEPSRYRLSSENLLHLEIYRRRVDVQAVVHAHPPAATAFAVAHISLDRPLLAEAVLVLGRVPLVDYAPPSTPRLAQRVGEAVATADAMLLANHGAVAVGDGLDQAVERMETLEHLARVSLLAQLLGRECPLPPAAVAELLNLRAGGPPRR